jgi:phosphatidylglycerol lysyltransferase
VDPDRQRALAILRRHAWETTSFQMLEAGFRHWFDGDAVVGYVDTGGAWVAGGAPVAAVDRLAEVAAGFTAAARAAGRRACFFACEDRFRARAGGRAILLGHQPVWDPAAWGATVAASRSLRYQVRRAAKKGVVVREVAPDEAARPGGFRAAAEALIATWLARRGMAPMRFLVDIEPFTFAHERVYVAAERDGALVGFAAAIPVYARGRLFVEDLLRAPGAPNGTAEALVDAAMHLAAGRGLAGLTLGLAPLAGPVPTALRVARRLAGPLYDFRGLEAFKSKLRPAAWEPVSLAVPPGTWRATALRDSLAAFAGGSLVGFGVRTALRPLRRVLGPSRQLGPG